MIHGVDDTVGIVFPILPEHLERFFSDQKTVFVKFVGRQATRQRLQPGSKLFFYESRGSKEVVGEARIAEIATGTIEEIIPRFGDEIFLTRDELEEYVGDRKTRSMLVLVLEALKKYTVPMRLGRSPTMAGMYMTKRMLKNTQKSIIAKQIGDARRAGT
jgi:hypothetical protein